MIFEGGIGGWNFEVYRMVQTVATWPVLSEVTNSISCNSTKSGSTLWCLIEGGLENCLKYTKFWILKKLLNSATFSVEKTRNE